MCQRASATPPPRELPPRRSVCVLIDTRTLLISRAVPSSYCYWQWHRCGSLYWSCACSSAPVCRSGHMAVPRSVSGAKGATVTSHWYSRGLRVSAAIAIAQRRRAQAHCRCAAAAADAAAASDEAPTLEEQAVAFSGLMDYAGASGPLELRAAPAGRGLGLFATAAVPEGGVLLSVPRSLCIAIDTDAGSLTIPEGDWPRLGGGIARPDEPLPCEQSSFGQPQALCCVLSHRHT